jgi:cystathionine beta-lyase
MKQDTVVVTAGRDPRANHGVVNPPVYHASTITFPTVAAIEEASRHRFDIGQTYYGRYGTPTTFAFEEAVAALEGGYRTVAMGSGKAAIVAVLTAFLDAGDHLLMVDTAYGPTRAFCNRFLARYGVETTYYDPLIGAGIADLIRPETKVVFTESPGSQTFEVQDIPAIAEVAHQAGCTVVLDNTWASPLLFKPFEHGVDVSIQAATKYIVGHSDVMMGTVTTTEAMHDRVRAAAFELGAPSGPDDVYLAQRGLRTLSVRLERHMKSGLAVAEWLQARPEVEHVLHPALPDDPGHVIWKRDFLGASGLFGVILEPISKPSVTAMLDGMDLFAMGYSWGGYESLIVPTDPAPMRTATPWQATGPSLRLHVGLEDVDDLITDLAAGFDRMNAAR